MSENRRILLLILIMAMVALMVGGISIVLLYQAAFQEAKLRLIDTAQSQARLLEAMARHEAGHIDDVAETTLAQIRDAHSQYAGIGKTGEFTLARLEGGMMIFLLRHRYYDLDLPQPVPFEGVLAEPMRRSLSGQSGTVVGLDYRGETVLAAFEPVAELDWGIVAKIDLQEIQAPFIRAGLIALLVGVLIVIIGAVLFVRTTNPLLQQLTESEERLRDLANNIPGVVAQFVLKKDGSFRIPYIGEGTRALYGFSPEEIQADPSLLFTMYSPEEITRIEKEMARSSQELEVFDLEYWITTSSGEGKWVRTTSIPKELENGDILWNGVTLDITDRKQIEEQLQQYSEQLEERVKERTQELQDTQEQLVRREKLAILGQLAGGVGHELRNPLGVINNAIYFLQMTLSGTDEKTREYLEIIASEVQGAEKIVSDLLDFSRIKSIDKEETSISGLVAQSLEKNPLPEEIQLSTEIPSDLPSVFVDSRQMEQVLINLLTNGCQAMPEGGELRIQARKEGNRVALFVTDTGCGISAENREKLFEPLFTTKARGIGLGLAVSRNLMEANGGSIEVESEEGKGSTFTLFLPTREVPV